MSTRESVHQLIDQLREEQLADVLDYLAELNDAGEVSGETSAAIAAKIEEGYAAAKAGDLIDGDQVRARMDERKAGWRNDSRRA